MFLENKKAKKIYSSIELIRIFLVIERKTQKRKQTDLIYKIRLFNDQTYRYSQTEENLRIEQHAEAIRIVRLQDI